MSEVIGVIFIFSAIIIGCTFMFGWEMPFKEKIKGIALFEIFIGLIVFGSYLLTKGK